MLKPSFINYELLHVCFIGSCLKYENNALNHLGQFTQLNRCNFATKM